MYVWIYFPRVSSKWQKYFYYLPFNLLSASLLTFTWLLTISRILTYLFILFWFSFQFEWPVWPRMSFELSLFSSIQHTVSYFLMVWYCGGFLRIFSRRNCNKIINNLIFFEQLLVWFWRFWMDVLGWSNFDINCLSLMTL